MRKNRERNAGKIAAGILALCMAAAGMPSVYAEETSADVTLPQLAEQKDLLAVTGSTKIPDTITQGSSIQIKGTVTSAVSNITLLTAAIYDRDGRQVCGKVTAPHARSYDLSKLDKYLTFDQLKPGTYTYAVMVTNRASRNYAIINKTFTVTGSSSDKLTVSGCTAPSSLRAGEGFPIKGTVTSGSEITALTVGVYDADGRFVTGKTIAPHTKSYDLHQLDSYVQFDLLTAGSYTFAVIASNASQTNYALVSRKFTVGSGSTAASDKLTLTGGTQVPTSMAVGKCLTVKGVVTSQTSAMKALTVGVYDSNGKFVTGKTINPSAKSYDLSKLDAYVEFNKLPAGTYTYAVIASNASQTNYALVSKKFTVGSGKTAASDKLTITGGTQVPTSLAVGKCLTVKGVVTSQTSAMKALTVGVYDSNGKFVTGKTIDPSAKSYDLSKLDAYVEFNKLPAGTYTYAVIVSNASQTNYALVSKKFTVGSGTTAASDKLTITGGTQVPASLAVGKCLTVKGVVTSQTSAMKALTVGVYDSNGKFVTGKTINPSAKSYDLSKLDAYVEFNKLPAGTYTYAVIASNASQTNYALVSKRFRIV